MFGLFGAQRKAAVRAAVDGLRPIIGTIQHVHGLPPRFWTDAYVLGFVNFSIAHFAKLATRGRITGEELGRAVTETYTALSNMNGAEIAKGALEFAQAENADFNRGGDDAAAVHYYSMRLLRNEADNPLVQRAAAVVARMQGVEVDNRRSETVAMMVMLSLVREVKERFNVDD